MIDSRDRDPVTKTMLLTWINFVSILFLVDINRAWYWWKNWVDGAKDWVVLLRNRPSFYVLLSLVMSLLHFITIFRSCSFGALWSYVPSVIKGLPETSVSVNWFSLFNWYGIPAGMSDLPGYLQGQLSVLMTACALFLVTSFFEGFIWLVFIFVCFRLHSGTIFLPSVGKSRQDNNISSPYKWASNNHLHYTQLCDNSTSINCRIKRTSLEPFVVALVTVSQR